MWAVRTIPSATALILPLLERAGCALPVVPPEQPIDRVRATASASR
jgi:hypothetical protein